VPFAAPYPVGSAKDSWHYVHISLVKVLPA
jgi:hypothetical protein